VSAEEAVFYVIAAVTVMASIGVVFSRSIIHAALFLILALLSVAGIFVLMAADFLAIVQVLVYGGAVTILILFAMMLTGVRDLPAAPDGPQKPFAFIAGMVFMVTSIAAVVSTEWRTGENGSTQAITPKALENISFENIGTALFTTWAVPFEIASLVLMAALIGRSSWPEVKRANDPDQQLPDPEHDPVFARHVRGVGAKKRSADLDVCRVDAAGREHQLHRFRGVPVPGGVYGDHLRGICDHHSGC